MPASQPAEPASQPAMNSEAADLDAPHINEYSMVENAGMRHAQELDYEKPATKSTAVAVESCKSIPGVSDHDDSGTDTARPRLAAHSIAAVVIACFSILVALGAMGIALTNMATMQSQVVATMEAATELETNTTCQCMYEYTH